MSALVRVEGLEKAVASLRIFPREVQLQQLRIAMNAAMSPIKRLAASNIHDDSGLLKKSLRIKIKIPDASRNTKHHGKPAYGLLGAGRGIVGFTSVTGRISAKTSKAAEKAAAQGKGHVAFGRDRGRLVQKRASRYSHIVEKGRRGHGAQHFLEKAVSQGASQATSEFIRKIVPGIYEEAKSLVNS